ncbi:MAG: DUF2163 domain-containing protein [Alphaproteobacteria bacterium]|nr:DUF2163 domain-containing protein [Alphaproteobacteria bacterium]
MALNLTPDQRAALRGHALGIRALADVYLDSGRYSFWDGDAHLNLNGALYLAAGAFAGATHISYGADLGAEGLELTLDGTRLAALSPDPLDPAQILATIEEETYQQRRVEVRFAFFSMETHALLFTLRRFAGVIDQIEQRTELSDDGARRLLIVKCESVARRYGRRLGRTRSNEDQQAIFPGDEFFKYVVPAVTTQGSLYWGKNPPPVRSGRPGGAPGNGPKTNPDKF